MWVKGKFGLVFFNDYDNLLWLMFGFSDNKVKLCLYNKNDKKVSVYDNHINDIDNKELGNPTKLSVHNSLVLFLPGDFNEDGEEENPVLQLIYLKN
jgi:hypothetical protein